MLDLPENIVVLERGWLSSNSVVFLSDDHAWVVDTGYSSHAEQTCALLASTVGNRSLQAIVNTHLHSDHCGGNAALQAKYPDASTCIPPGLSHAVQKWDALALSYEPTGQYCPPFRFDRLLKHGDVLCWGQHTLQVHAAAGHDTHAVMLFEPEKRILISADALWENGFGVVFPELDGESAFEEVRCTLDTIEALQAAGVIPGHGSPFDDVPAALERARKRLQQFQGDPVFHAKYAGKVLIKFKLLDCQRCRAESLFSWAKRTPYFEQLRQRFFANLSFNTWFESLINELLRTGAAKRMGDDIFNV